MHNSLEEQVGVQVKIEEDGEGVHCAGAACTLYTEQQVKQVAQKQVQVVKEVAHMRVKEVGEAELQPAGLLLGEKKGDMGVGQDDIQEDAQNL